MLQTKYIMKSQSKILILTCIWKRHEIFEIFKENIKILQKKYNIDLLVVGSEGEVSKNLCKDFYYVESENQPLSNKWNNGIKYAKQLEWDYLLILGSDDVVNDLQFYYDNIKKGYNFIGALDCWTYNTLNDSVYYFGGYKNYRAGESVGAGRLISRTIIEQMNYSLWDNGLKRSLDFSFEKRLNDIPFVKKKLFIGKHEGIINLGIYTNENITKKWMFKPEDDERINKGVIFKYFDKKIIDKIKALTPPTCLVIIPVYNQERDLRACINSVIAQTYKHIRIAIIDDYSTDDTLRVAQCYRDDRIVIYHNYTNKGCYNSINTVLQNETDYDCWMLQGSDDVMVSDRVEKQFIKYDSQYIASICEYRRKKGDEILYDGFGHSMLCYSRKVFEEIGYFDDTRFSGDTEYWLRFNRKYSESKLKRINEILYVAYLKENGLTCQLYPIGSEIRKEYSMKFEQEHIKMQKSDNYYRDFTDKNKVIFSLAALEVRQESLKDTIESVINQCDEVNIYCNEWNNIPDFLLNNYKINIFKSQDEVGDLGDVGKFYGLQNKVGYLFTIDDDLIYSKDYVSISIAGIKKYDTPVSFHGKIFCEPPIKSYHKGSIIENFRCQNIVEYDREVQVIGSGCFAYHSDMINYDVKDFIYINMSDIFASILAHKKGLKLYVLAHEEGFIQESKKVDEEESIYYKNYQKEERHIKLINDNYKYFTNFVKEKENVIIFVEKIKEPEPIIMKLTVGGIEMTKVKVIAIKATFEGAKFATIGDIMWLEESTANVLIKRGLVATYNDELKASLDKNVEDAILKDALKSATKSKKEYKEEIIYTDQEEKLIANSGKEPEIENENKHFEDNEVLNLKDNPDAEILKEVETKEKKEKVIKPKTKKKITKNK